MDKGFDVTVSSSYFPRKDIDRQKKPSLGLALEASFAMWSVQKRQWLMVIKAYKFRRLNLFQWIIREIDWWVCLKIIPEQ